MPAPAGFFIENQTRMNPVLKSRTGGKMKRYNVAVVGATGMVGQKMLQVLEEMKFPVDNLYPMASARSAGKTVQFDSQRLYR